MEAASLMGDFACLVIPVSGYTQPAMLSKTPEADPQYPPIVVETLPAKRTSLGEAG